MHWYSEFQSGAMAASQNLASVCVFVGMKQFRGQSQAGKHLGAVKIWL
jgi:hypothetical protein